MILQYNLSIIINRQSLKPKTSKIALWISSLFEVQYNNRMMQTPKYQFARKPRKLLSRDRKQVAAFPSSRQKSRDSEDKRIPTENSPNKPHQLISNLRCQLTNLRQEVAKLSKRDQKRPNVSNDPRQQYDLKSPKEIKKISSYYFEEVKSTLPSDISPDKMKVSDDNLSAKASSQVWAEQFQKIKQQKAELQVKNSQLSKANELLAIKVKQALEIARRQYQTKIHQIEAQREKTFRVKQNEQNDRTINFQRQVIENKQVISDLKNQVLQLTQQNEKMKLQIEKYKDLQAIFQKLQLEAVEKQSEIAALRGEITCMKNQLQDLSQQEQVQKEAFQKLASEKEQLLKTIKQQSLFAQDLKCKLDQTVKRSQQLEKKLQKLQKLSISKHQPQQPKKKTKGKNEDNRQLYQIISMQQKSIANQQSDLNYLQGQLRKLNFAKFMTKCQAKLLQDLNEQVLRLNLANLNHRYIQQ